MEYAAIALLALFIAGLTAYYRKDFIRIFRKILFIKDCADKKEDKAQADAGEDDTDRLARKIARAWWREYNQRMWIKVVFALLLFIIGVSAVDSYVESLINRLKDMFGGFLPP